MAYDVEQTRPRSRRRGRKAVWIVLISVAVLVIGSLAAALLYLNSLGNTYDDSVTTFEDETFPDESTRPTKDEDDDSVNILLLGSDEHGGSGETEELPDVPQGGRSDTMMLVHIPGNRESVQVMSIPRDLWVEVPGEGEHKVNAALSLGGLPKTVETVENLFDARIDHIASVDMMGFIGLVDALDGVTVDSEYPESFTTGDDFTFEPGEQEMNSEEALSFVRHRASFPDGDLQRVRNQQAFIRGVLQDTLSPSNLANPGRMQDMVSTFSPYLVVDETLDSGTVASLGWELRGGLDNIQMFTVPTGGDGYSDDGQWIFYQDEEQMAEITEAMDTDTLQEYAENL